MKSYNAKTDLDITVLLISVMIWILPIYKYFMNCCWVVQMKYIARNCLGVCIFLRLKVSAFKMAKSFLIPNLRPAWSSFFQPLPLYLYFSLAPEERNLKRYRFQLSFHQHSPAKYLPPLIAPDATPLSILAHYPGRAGRVMSCHPWDIASVFIKATTSPTVCSVAEWVEQSLGVLISIPNTLW